MITYEKSPQNQKPLSYMKEFSLSYSNQKQNQTPSNALTDFSTPNYGKYSKYFIDIDRSNESLSRMFHLYDKLLFLDIKVYSSEGFFETVKETAKRIIRAIIMIVKAILNWIKAALRAFGNFVRDKIFHRLFGRKRSKESILRINRAYNKYSNLSICNPFNNDSFTKEDYYDTKVTYSDEDIPPLRDTLKESLKYMNYKTDNFDIVGRTAAMAATAIDSMIIALQKSKNDNGNNIFIRNYQIRYGNKKDEKDYLSYQKENPLITLPLYFYHEKSFMQFIFHIDKLTNGNISSLITDRVKYGPHPSIELKIDLKVKGSDVAKAIILNCSLDKLKEFETKTQALNPDDIRINDVISKEVLLRILAGDATILNKLQKEAEDSYNACEDLNDAYTDFEKRLSVYNQELIDSKIKTVENYVGIKEANDWMSFMTTFVQTFMTYRTNMIHLINRIIKILEKKSNEEQYSNFGKTNNTPINTSHGVIKRLNKEQWNSLSYSEIMRDSREIVKRHSINMHYNNRVPIYIIPVREHADEMGLNAGSLGFNSALYLIQNNRQKSLDDFIKLFRLPNPTEYDLLEKYILQKNDTASAQPKGIDCILVGSVMIINTNLYLAYIAEVEKKKMNFDILYYFPPSVLYYGSIIHETTHAIQKAYNVKTNADDRYGLTTGDSDLEQKIHEKRAANEEKDLIELTRKFAYNFSPLHEREAFSEQYKFLMSTISDIDSQDKNSVSEDLKTIMKLH
jgi:hypothetical protein